MDRPDEGGDVGGAVSTPDPRRLVLARIRFLTVVAFVMASTVYADDFTDGMAAYKRGDFETAVTLYRKAAEQGHAPAQLNLGLMYMRGLGVPKNAAEAVKWFRKAAEQGHTPAQYNLGVAYRDGHGVAKNVTEAVKWFRKAAEQRYAPAQANLGGMYVEGWGVPKNVAEAVKWYRKAADQGHANAQYNLGAMYVNGWGVPRDYIVAYMWFSIAGAQGFQAALKTRDVIANEMDPADISKADRLAREWMEKHRK